MVPIRKAELHEPAMSSQYYFPRKFNTFRIEPVVGFYAQSDIPISMWKSKSHTPTERSIPIRFKIRWLPFRDELTNILYIIPSLVRNLSHYRGGNLHASSRGDPYPL